MLPRAQTRWRPPTGSPTRKRRLPPNGARRRRRRRSRGTRSPWRSRSALPRQFWRCRRKRNGSASKRRPPPPAAAGSAQRYAEHGEYQRAGRRERRSRARIRAQRGRDAAQDEAQERWGVRNGAREVHDYRDGAVVSAAITKSSGNTKLDNLALQAVQRTKSRTPPAGMTTTQLFYELPYHFR